MLVLHSGKIYNSWNDIEGIPLLLGMMLFNVQLCICFQLGWYYYYNNVSYMDCSNARVLPQIYELVAYITINSLESPVKFNS